MKNSSGFGKFEVLTVIVLLMIGLVIFKKKNKKKDLKKEDKLKFTDVMTSLKNRNYLNYNIMLSSILYKIYYLLDLIRKFH